jgi:hypothetical protein
VYAESRFFLQALLQAAKPGNAAAPQGPPAHDADELCN